MTSEGDAELTSEPRPAEGSLLSRPARRAYDASFGKIRREVATLRADMHRLINGLDASQVELTHSLVELSERVEQLNTYVRTIVAGRMEIDAITRRLATIEDHLIDDRSPDATGSARRSTDASS